MEAIFSPGMSVDFKRNHRCENLGSYKVRRVVIERA
jgi:hypothetical protein